jgi:hypothetical protein
VASGIALRFRIMLPRRRLASRADGAQAGAAAKGDQDLGFAGPLGQIGPAASPGRGCAAIIVASLGWLHPVGILLAGLLTGPPLRSPGFRREPRTSAC